MSDPHANTPADEPADDEPLESTDDTPEPDATDDEPAPGDDEPAEPTDDEPEPDEPPASRARGVPDAGQRARRLTEQERIDRAVRRALDEDRARRTSQPTVDFAEQRRQLDTRRREEINQAKLEGNEAEVRDRHLREDYQADMRARDAREQDSREESRFERICDRDPIVAAVRDRVDDRIRDMRANGFVGPINREIVANDIIARDLRSRAAKQGGRQRREAAETTRRQTVRAPASTAGHQPASRSRRNVPDSQLTAEEFEAKYGNEPVLRKA